MKNIIVTPTYNEKDNINRLIPTIFEILPDIFVLVVDDNSPDGTADAVKQLQKKFPNLSLLLRENKNGLGQAYINGFREVLRDPNINKVVMMDADLSHDPVELPKMLDLSKRYDVVVGSRYIRGGRTEGWEMWRKILSRGGNLYSRIITGMPIFDCTSGFNVINANFLRKIDFSKMDASGYAFIMELKYLLWKTGVKFKETPIIFKNRFEGESKISNHIIREGIIAPWKMKFQK